ncbi:MULTISPECIES: DUF2277 domain-containing protein [Streptomyces]|uniref:DUF2277 domain-containing protein n=1 Tax=Streptomyces TaxID=1883 RepID=UPI00099D94A4|nr:MULTISPECIES: DUF2277 domain-containing protein [Streptomyces]MBT3073907.1 DUF2277 domain-containing protein [Streptomyces sp. COG21]MBT3083817.1 DUF2277 domain-containing protein [Streptomyces sp. COG20]MBT3088799.1 DUF2277 domain-containing protein [Streptomyces sp. CYG21]MBT3096704.1 DUF2277 domain-containing protein [Streptomyces sp. CBG30]MBT3101541.1 DUF2277 domain-containing protein [Streptomyces sp. COG19]
MCRSIKTLRPPALPQEATEEDMRAAALQYVRKVSGFRAPAAHNREVFDRAVDEITAATMKLLGGLEIRGSAHGHAAHEHAPGDAVDAASARGASGG